MAEAIALGASVIAMIQMADRIIGLCKFYIETARDAPSDLRTIFIETSALKTTLENLDYLDKHDGANSTIAKNICGPNGPVEGCNQTLAALEKLFPDGNPKSSSRKKTTGLKIDTILTYLAWPLKETKARKLLDELVRYKTTINLALTTGIAQDVRYIKEETLRIYDMLKESQSREVYTWLEHTDPSSLHQRASKNYEPETGTWIWKSPEWTDWIACKHRAIHIHGIPGAGKTVLMSYLIGQIEKYCNQDPDINRVYVYYYCYFAHKQDETRPFLKWLIGRMCWKAGGIPLFVSNLRAHGAEPSLEDLLEAVAQLLSFFDTVFVAIDAVNESQPYDELLKVLQTLATDRKFQRLQIVTSGRQHRDIEQVMRSISQLISMSNPFVEQDIRRYVQSTLQRNPHFHKWPQDLLNEVEESLAMRASGMFRWVVCQIDIIRRLKHERNIIQNTLKTLPETLYETYDMIVQIMPKEDRMFVYYTLRWIAFRNEINIGNAVPYRALIGAAEASILRLTGSPNMRLYDKDRLADVCGCLINIGSLKAFDYMDKNNIDDLNDGVTFAHHSVQEYLDSNLDLGSLFGRHTLRGAGLKSHLLEIAFTEAQLLNEDELSNIISASPQESSSLDAVLAIWSSCFDFRIYNIIWASTSLYTFFDHIRCNESLRTLAIDLLDPSRPHYPTMEILMTYLDKYMPQAKRGLYRSGKYFPWRMLWDPKTENDLKHLGNLLFLAQDSRERFSLAESFLDTKDRKSLLQAQICFSKSTYIRPLEGAKDGELELKFKGSFVEIFAQLAFDLSNTFEFLMEISADLFDPSIVLAQYLGGANMDSERDDGSHPVQRLLELGADPNLQGYKITPLQIASFSADPVGAKVLLRAGAQPDDTGTPNGVTWEDDSLMYRIASIHGASPLSICRSIWNLRDAPGYFRSKENRKKLEEALLNHGSEDFVVPSCELAYEDGETGRWFIEADMMWLNDPRKRLAL